MTGVRQSAAEILWQTAQGQVTLGTALDRAQRTTAAPRDRGLLVELATGALRWRGELDAVIAAASRRSVETIDPRALAVLRVGAYQIRHLERVPPHAIVHESVEAARGMGAARAAGFVNAVLRAILRRGPAIALPPRPGPDASRAVQLAYLSVTLSHPAWLVSRWLDRDGFDTTERWCRFNNAAPEITVRPAGRLDAPALLDALNTAGVTARPAPFVADAIRLAPGSLGRVPADLRRELQVQDEGAQLVARAAGVRPGERVLDVCAAPGGKTLVLARDMGLDGHATGTLVAADHRRGRVALLRETLARVGLPVPIVRLDARTPLPFGAVFDCVLLDAPCSGLGTIRRDPDLKWRRTGGDLARFAATERRLLASAAEVVRPGGRLVYATCSSEPEENMAVVDGLLADDARFSLAAVPRTIPAALIDPRGCLATMPPVHELDAFFAAVLVRRHAA